MVGLKAMNRVIGMGRTMDEIYQTVYQQFLKSGRKWSFDGQKAVPLYEDVKLLIDEMIKQVRNSSGSISVESGGILVKRTDDYIDVYVHAGGVK